MYFLDWIVLEACLPAMLLLALYPGRRQNSREDYYLGGQRAAVAGFLVRLASNLAMWKRLPQVAWLWWNLSGFLAGWAVALAAGVGCGGGERPTLPWRACLQLLAMAVFILCVCALLQLA